MAEWIAQGAEAVLYKEGDILVKERVKKSYRISQIDNKLRKSRTNLEAKLLREARRVGVMTPQIKDISANKLKMQFVHGIRVKDALNNDNLHVIAQKMGRSVAKLHEYNIIHGDLTTSNMILEGDPDKNISLESAKLFLIDFGLGFHSSRIEDKATDLYLLYHAIESTHWNIMDELWGSVLKSYKTNFQEAQKVIKTLSDIEKRGRYRQRS